MSLEQYENKIVRTRGKGTIAFELLDPDLFYMTGYKVIRNFNGGGLIIALKSLLNGKTRLVYDLKDLSPVISVEDEMDPNGFLALLQSLLSLCERIRENGFIRSEDLCLEEDMIFVDRSSGQAWLIYVPLKPTDAMAVETESIERRLAKLLSEMIAAHPKLTDSRMHPVSEYLESGKSDITQINRLLTKACAQKPDNDASVSAGIGDAGGCPRSLILERIGGGQSLILCIPSKGAVIGRNEELAQLIIQDSSVSKKHCHIHKDGNRWLIEDLKSSNHTWLGENGQWLVPYTECELHPGDVVHIARFAFLVKAGIGD